MTDTQSATNPYKRNVVLSLDQIKEKYAKTTCPNCNYSLPKLWLYELLPRFGSHVHLHTFTCGLCGLILFHRTKVL